MIIAIDTETTGLLKPNAAPLSEQPKIIEIYCAKYSYDGDMIESFHSMINPEILLPEIITKITGIKDNDVKNAPTFVEIYKELAHFFVGCNHMTAHNLGFDRSMLGNELLRIDKVLAFPWPPIQLCTVVHSYDIRGYRLNLDKLYRELFGIDRPGTKHRAENDVKDQAKCFFELVKRGHIIL